MLPQFNTGMPQRAGQPQTMQNFGPQGNMPFGGRPAMPTRFQGPAGGQPPVAPVGRPAMPVPRATPQGPMQAGPTPNGPLMGSFKKGGKVKKTGNYKLHAGERVLTKKQAKLAPVALLLRAKG